MHKNFGNPLLGVSLGFRTGKFADPGIEVRLFSFVGDPGWASGILYYFKLNMFRYCIQVFKVGMRENYE